MNCSFFSILRAWVIGSAVLTGPLCTADEVIARVGEMEVKAEEVRPVLEGLEARERAALEKDPALLNQLVRTLMVQRLVLKEAQTKNWEKQPEVAAKLERLRASTIAESYLKSVSGADYQPSEEELKHAYEALKASLQAPKQIQLAQVFIAVSKDADQAAKDKAKGEIDSVQKQVKASGSDFAAIARAHSEEAASAARGGEIGWLAEAQIQPEIRKKVEFMKAGAVTEPMLMDDGWHLVKVLDRKDARTLSLDEVKPQLRERLRAEHQRAQSQAYVAKLVAENPVVINEIALSKALNEAKQ